MRATPPGGSAFVGRARERAELAALLDGARLVTLTGPGGSGKTRLAAEVTADAGQRLSDGAAWTALAGLRDPAMVAPAVAAAAGVHDRASPDVVDALVEHLQERRVLLVLDNCEHLVDACAALADALVRCCPGVTVLATSREPLRVEGEATYQLGPLSVPSPTATSVAEVASTDAARLFELRAGQVRHGFRIDDDNAAAVAAICRRLDGIPLALELAAARTRVLTPAQIAENLADRFQLLTGGHRTALPRQRTLEASVDWSYDLLDDTQRRALTHLSVFTGSFGLDAAEAVVGGPELNGTSALDVLTELVERSLVQVGELDGQARYRLLETIRLYAADRLDDAGSVRDLHLDFYAGLARRAQPNLTGPAPEPWLRRLTADLDDLRAAMDWAMASKRPLAVLDITEPTFAFWIVRGLYAEMHRRLQAAVESPALRDAERARGLTTASIVAFMGGDHRAGHEFAGRALPLARAVDDERTLTRALVFRSWTGFFSGRARGAEVWADCEEAIARAEGLGDPEQLARALMYGGTLTMSGRTFAGGRAQLERALAVIEDAGITFLVPSVRAFLATWTAMAGRDLDDARRHAAEGVEVGRRIGLHAFVSLALIGGAVADIHSGDGPGARERLAEARTVARRGGLPGFEQIAERWLAVAEYRFGEASDAHRAAATALRDAEAVGSRFNQAAAAWLLGVLHLRAGDAARARRQLDHARDLSLEPRYPFSLGRALVGLAQLEMVGCRPSGGDEVDAPVARGRAGDGADPGADASGDLPAAWELAHEALDVLAAAGDHAGTAAALETVAGLLVAFDRPEQALRLLAAVDAHHAGAGTQRLPVEAELQARHVAAARSGLGARRGDARWREGAALSLDEAVAYARRGRGDRGRPQTGWHSLTPAEENVAALVAQGCTNAEIGERLFISVNTVKTHLSHIYAKVDVDGRAQLAAEIARRATDHPDG